MALPPNTETKETNGRSLTFFKCATIALMGLGTGSSLNINISVMPSLAKVPASTAALLWTNMVVPSMAIQVSAYMLGFLGGMILYYKTKNKYYLYGGLIMASIFPYTMAMFVPINKHIFAFVKSGLEDVDGSMAEMMWIWNRNQYGRTVLNAAGFLTTLFGAVSDQGQDEQKDNHGSTKGKTL